MRPTLTWHRGDGVPHVTPAPATDAEGRPLPGEWERYRAALRAHDSCPNADIGPLGHRGPL